MEISSETTIVSNTGKVFEDTISSHMRACDHGLIITCKKWGNFKPHARIYQQSAVVRTSIYMIKMINQRNLSYMVI
jgi:hypothetical protein